MTQPMDALYRAAQWMRSAHPRSPATFTEYLARLDPDELLAVAVLAQSASERSAWHDPARALLFRAVAATAGDVIDAREHDRQFPSAAILPRMIEATSAAR